MVFGDIIHHLCIILTGLYKDVLLKHYQIGECVNRKKLNNW